MQYASAQSCPVEVDQLQPLSFGAPVPVYRADQPGIALPCKIVQTVIIVADICCHVSYVSGSGLIISRYAWLSHMFAGVTHAESGTTILPVLQHMCNLYPNTHPLVLAKPHLASVSIPERGTKSDLMWVWCQTWPRQRTSVLSADTIFASAMPSRTICLPTVLIMCWSGSTLNLLSKVLLSGREWRPHDCIILLWNAVSVERK